MLASTYSSSTSINFPRRMLLHTPFFHHKPPPPPPLYPLPPKRGGGSSIDANVMMIFSVLLCLLIFSICVNCIIRCMLKCLMMISQDHQGYNNNNQQKEVSNCGVKKRALKTFPIVKYSKEVAKVQGLSTECVICLSEFKSGVKIRVLPKCNHGFHVKCIDKWLSSNSSCPTCRHSMVDTCHKVIGSHHDGHDGDQHHHHHEGTSSSSSSSSSLPSSSSDVDHVVVNILPLGREDVIRN